ncbi:metallophosphoesterase [Bacillus sp. JJ1764]|uniref:metallophosphoesterase n=1 Tax=Bacillus sp. JJ1764 TaxID=3122964 RepID=UPI00300083DC
MWLFIMVLLVYNLLLYYIGWNGWKWVRSLIGDKKRVKMLFWFFLILFAYSFFFGRWLENNLVITWAGAIWLGLLYLFIFLLPIVNIMVYFSKFIHIPREKAVKWSGFILLMIIAGLFFWGMHNAYSPVVRNYQVNIPKKVEGKQKLSIVMASDMHFGSLANKRQAEKLVKEINTLHPDLVLFPGDIIDDDIDPYVKNGIPKILRQIKAPIFASFGNHDREKPQVNLKKIFEESGMKLLTDEVIVLDKGMTIVGRKDRGYQDVVRKTLKDLMKHVNHSNPIILMDHQPYDLNIARKNGVDLMVSGHTHRGQIAPANWITSMIYENDWGYLKKGKMTSIVSSGYGFWGTPLRIGTRSEIVHITLTFHQ